MRNWWKTLAIVAGSVLTLAGTWSSAWGQFPQGMGGPPGMGMGGPPGMGMGGPPGMMGMGGPPPGVFGGPAPGMPAEFPNPAQPSQEPASPFSIKDEGMPNAFTDLVDPRPRRIDPYTWSLRAEYLWWWIQKGDTPALVTTNSTVPPQVGAIGETNTRVVSGGGSAIDYPLIPGFRLTAGLAIGYLPPIEVSGFLVTRKWVVFAGGGNGQYLARPLQFVNIPATPVSGLETVEFVNVPGTAVGSINITSRMSYWGLDVNALFDFCDTSALRMAFIMGYRHNDLYESLEITHSITNNNPLIPQVRNLPVAGLTNTTVDQFRTRNSFDGGQIGLRAILSSGRFSLFTDLKLGMGVTTQHLLVDGYTNFASSNAGRGNASTSGGILAVRSNSGSRNERDFSLLPEGNMTLSCQVSPRVRVFGGYNVQYWQNVIRPGDHISSIGDSQQIPSDVTFNPNITATTPRAPSFVTRSFYSHGFQVGIEFGF